MILTLIQTLEQNIEGIVFRLEWEEQPWVGCRDKTEKDSETEIEGDVEEQESS